MKDRIAKSLIKRVKHVPSPFQGEGQDGGDHHQGPTPLPFQERTKGGVMKDRIAKSLIKPVKHVPSPWKGEGQDGGERYQGPTPLHPHPGPPPSRGREHNKRLLNTRRARTLRKNMTDTESCLWSRLRKRQINGCKFRRQFPLDRYIVDFVCLEARLVIEVDGGQHAEQTANDEMRDKWLASQGFRVLRFWNHDVLRETDAVVEKIMRVLNETPTPSLPHKGGGRNGRQLV